MRTLILLYYVFIFSFNSIGQVTIFVEDFELSGNFSFSGDLIPNNWRINNCAGNGASLGGINSLYISQGGSTPDCGPTGDYQYGYIASPSGVRTVTAITQIDALCFADLNYSIDYQINTLDGGDIAQLLYSINNGVTWNVLTSLASSPGWSNLTGTFPIDASNSEILLAVSFTYDDNAVTGIPIAVDNLIIDGVSTDIVAPLLTCESMGLIEVNNSCQAVVNLLEKYVLTVFDNCTDSADISYIYNPPVNTVLTGNVGDFVSVELIGVDENGNQSDACIISVELVDLVSPTILSCQLDTTVYLNASCEYVMGDFTSLISATDNCSSLIYTQSVPIGTVISGTQTQTITLTTTDASGNTNSCMFNLSTADTSVATITCPPDQIVYSNAVCQGVLLDYTGLSVYSDNCVPNSLLTVTQTPSAGVTITADQIVTLQVNGGFPATPQTCAFTVQFIDTLDPSISCPIAQQHYLNNSCEHILTDYTSSILWSDNCESVFANMVVVQNPAPLSVLTQTTNIELTISDPSGNSATCNFNVVLQDTIDPTIVCPANTNQARNASCQVDLNDYRSLAVGTDNCTVSGSLVYTQSPAPTSVIATPTTVTITVTDAALNEQSCQFLVTPVDTTAPTITCPTNLQQTSNASCQYVLANESGIIAFDDNCTSSTSLIITQNPIAGTSISLGITPVVFTFEDEAGNSNSCSVNFEVVDLTNPTITNCPSSTTIYADQNCDVVLQNYSSGIVASDNCTSLANLSITQNPVAGTSISASQIITISVTDEANNTAQCNFNITILDTIAPIIICTGDTTISINSSCQFVMPDFGPTVSGTDNCSVFSAMTITQTPAPTTNQSGMTVAILTLTDEQGNSSSCSINITPLDTIAPQIICPTIAAIDNGASCDFVLPDYSGLATASDNCGSYTINQNPPMGTIIPNGTSTINLTIMDAIGNASGCNFSLTTFESVAPTINCPAAIQSCNPLVTFVEPTFNDNCSAVIAQTDLSGLSSGDIFPVGTTTLEYSVTDASGNAASCSFNVEILEAPNATILQDTIALCGVNSVLLEAQPATGVWTVLSGQGNFNNQFAFQTGVNNLPFGTSVFVWTVATASCGTESDTVVVINSMAPSLANTQDTVLACGQNQINLFTSSPMSGSGLWTTLQGGIITNPTNNVTTASNLADGWNDFIWTISNPGCPSNSDTMRVLSTGNVKIFTNDTTFCFENSNGITLSGTIPGSGQTVMWNFGSGSGMFSHPNAPSTGVTSLSLGENLIIYTIDYELCPPDKDTILILVNTCDGFNPVFPTVITPNADGKNDVFEIQNLEKIYPNCTMTIFNRWGSVVFESVGYVDPWNGTYKGEKLPMGTYFFKLELNDENNQQYNGPISIIH